MSGSIKRILISGAAGFIGSHLTRKLLQQGYEVGIIEHQDCQYCRIEDILDKLTDHTCDLRNTSGILDVVENFRPDLIFHLATYYTVEHKPDEIKTMVETNVLGTLNLLEAARVFEIVYFVNTSSSFVYGQKPHPAKENEELNPLNLYALTKLQAEEACSFYAQRYGIKVVTFRLYPPYGPSDHERKLIPHAIKCFSTGASLKLTTGKQRWDFIEVSNIIKAYIRLLEESCFPEGHAVFNIGTGKAVSIREIVERIQLIMRVDYEPEWGVYPQRENEVMFLCGDIERARKHLAWQPEVTLSEGLETTINWFTQHFSKERSESGKTD